MIFVGTGVFGQQNALHFPLKITPGAIQIRSVLGNKLLKDYRNVSCDTAAKADRINIRPYSYLPGNFYSAHLGFVCQQEIRFEKSTGIPFRFRLGSVQQVDWLEGKRMGFNYSR